MKSILISIKPQFCELIASGKKTVEVRKNKPKINTPFKVYIYCTQPNTTNPHEILEIHSGGKIYKANGKVIGEFVCDKITRFDGEFWDDETYERLQEMYEPDDFHEYGEYEYTTIATNEDDDYKDNWVCKQSCVSWEGLREYIGTGSHEFYGWHISHLKIYDVPKELSTLSTIDTMSVKKCEYRERVFNTPDLVNGAWLPGSFVCNKDELDWCSKCKTKPIIRPPQSWCYVEELQIPKLS